MAKLISQAGRYPRRRSGCQGVQWRNNCPGHGRVVRVFFAAIALVSLLSGKGFSASPRLPEASFEEANKLYTSGMFEQAATIYEQLIDRGIVHEDLYYNLGNSYFRVGRVGLAVYNYERALRLEPSYEDARYNLGVAREVVAERFASRLAGAEQDPVWRRAVTFFSLATLSLIVLGLNVLFFGALVALRFLTESFRRTALIVSSAFAGLALVVAVLLFAGHIYLVERVDLGIVLPDQVVMREGADERSAERGLLHPGLRVEIVGRAPRGWLRVRLSNGVDGWVPNDTIGRLRIASDK